MSLSPVATAFVKHFGEMSSRWGINRSVGQIFAFIYISKYHVSADEIAISLGCSRSNVSMGLKELEAWRLIQLHHVTGDRREYFSTFDDIWEITRVIAAERKRREIDPTLSMLRALLNEKPEGDTDHWSYTRLRDMYEVIDLLGGWADDAQRLPTTYILRLLKFGRLAARKLRINGRSSAPAKIGT